MITLMIDRVESDDDEDVYDDYDVADDDGDGDDNVCYWVDDEYDVKE